ncbi:MAG TPA: Uma2 family endonuclease [Longimicrobium sp.]|nr:Uma2 family endonuclease [Longimicrobium sp.]
MAAAPGVVTADEMSFEDFLVRYEGVHAEWVDRRVRLDEARDAETSRLKRFLGSLLQTWAEDRGLGEVFVGPLAVRLDEHRVLKPDLFFVGAVHAGEMTATHFAGVPELVVEIPSVATRGRARGQRWCDYETAGVQEYWLIDPDREIAEAWRLGPKGWYEPVQLGTPPVLQSDAMGGLRIPAAWLWRKPVPRLRKILREWE